MKKLFLSIIAGLTAVATYAQNSLLATLSHEGEISTYYGTVALRDAYNAASHGDIITLSSGTFLATNIEKAVTIRGAGMDIDTTTQSEPTIIAGDFDIKIADSISSRLILEGIFHNHTIYVKGTFKNGIFLKDRFNTILESDAATFSNLTLTHCKIANKFDITNASATSISFVNCVVLNPLFANNAAVEFINSIVERTVYTDWINYFGMSSFRNSILIVKYNSNGNYLTSDCTSYNSVAVNLGNNMFNNISNTTNSCKSFTEVFKTYTGDKYNDNETFELSDAAKTTLLGIDGTQVGIYGGNLPFSVTPTNPQITKCNVAAKSTADGKLSVDIQVSTAE